MSRRFRIGRPAQADTIVDLDGTNMSASIQVTGRAFVNAANDLYNGIQTTRYNRSRFARIRTYRPGSLTFLVQGITGGLANIGVVVNGALFANVPIDVSTAVSRWYTIAGMVVGSKTVDLYEEFEDRVTNLNSGIDGRCSACYLKKIALPPGSGGTIGRVTADTVIAAFGDSHMDGDANNPISVNGSIGQLRRAALAVGQSLVYVGAGSSTLCGDGPTATETAAMIHDGWAQSGATTKILFMKRRPNDYAYYAPANGPGTYSPTDYQNYLIAMFAALDASDPGWTGVCSRIPQGTGWGNNAGGFSRAAYWTATTNAATSGGRTNVVTHDETDYTTLSLATDYVEAPNLQVHPNQAGNDKEFATERAWFGL